MKACKENKGIFSPIGVTLGEGGKKGGKRNSNDPQIFPPPTHIYLGLLTYSMEQSP
jgi:hypothetical protein